MRLELWLWPLPRGRERRVGRRQAAAAERAAGSASPVGTGEVGEAAGRTRRGKHSMAPSPAALPGEGAFTPRPAAPCKPAA